MKRFFFAIMLVGAQAGGAMAQTLLLPAPATTDPVALGLMMGFPPQPEKIVTLANVLKYPNARWAFHHLRELGPTINVWRGSNAARSFATELRDLDGIAFADDKGRTTKIAVWQTETYTDALLVLHDGKIVYENTMPAWCPNNRMSCGR